MTHIIIPFIVWRITEFFVYADGPYNVFEKFREVNANNQIGKALDCFHCTSVWVALPFAIWQETLLMWLFYSTVAIIIETLIEALRDV